MAVIKSVKVNLLFQCLQNRRIMGLCQIPWRGERAVCYSHPKPWFWGHIWGQGSQCCSIPTLQPGHEGRTEGSNPFLWEKWAVGSFTHSCVCSAELQTLFTQQTGSVWWVGQVLVSLHKCFPQFLECHQLAALSQRNPRIFTFSLCQSNPELSLPIKDITVIGNC